jgi:hypothetical protein
MLEIAQSFGFTIDQLLNDKLRKAVKNVATQYQNPEKSAE